MIIGIGVDAADITRSGRLSDSARKKIFHPLELEQYEALSGADRQIRDQFLASRFAVKEAYAKARGKGFCAEIVPSEICTCKDENGKPFIRLYGKTAQNAPLCEMHLSITHQMPLAVAFVILEVNDGKN